MLVRAPPPRRLAWAPDANPNAFTKRKSAPNAISARSNDNERLASLFFILLPSGIDGRPTSVLYYAFSIIAPELPPPTERCK